MTRGMKDLSSTAIAGEVAIAIAQQSRRSEGAQRVCAANIILSINPTAYTSFEGADAPYPLCPVGHLPLFDFFEIVQREKDKRGPVS